MTIDVLIKNAKVVDGTGNPWYYGEVAISGDTIAAVGPRNSITPDADTEIVDAGGKVICPGFIDIQSHSILPLMIDGRCVSKITQGITTEIMGEGWTPAPFGGKIDDPLENAFFAQKIGDWHQKMYTWRHFSDWLEEYVAQGVSPNVGSYLGGGTLRSYVMGMSMNKPSPAEMEEMRQVMAQAMEDGAFGVSYALIYPPDTFADTDEIVEVCKIVSKYNGTYITHMRSEADELLEGLEETFEIARRANVATEIYHLKASGKRNWWKMPTVMENITQARAEGLDITVDMYPYPGAGTGLASVLPPWAQADGKFQENLRNPEMRERIRNEALDPGPGWEAMADLNGPEAVMPVGFRKPENQKYVAKRLNEIAADMGVDWATAAMDLLASEGQNISTIYFMMDEANVREQLKQPWIKISTDAGGFDPEWAKPMGPYHPRAYGTYTRVLGKYVREEKVIPLEDAIRKMTSSVADRLCLYDRGQLRSGFAADVVLFDPETVSDMATFEDPHQLSVGISDVWVNGGRVVKDGVHTGATPGRFVKGPGYKQ